MSAPAVTYAQTLKPAAVETPLDLWLFRPAAWGVVRLVLPTRVSANQLTGLSIVTGLAGAALLASHDRALLALSAVLSLVYGIFDCADGQLARARGTSSRVGRILDGMSDYIVGAASGAAVAVNLGARMGSPGVALGLAGFGSVVLQGTLFDHFKNTWLTRSRAAYREGDDLEETLADLAAARASRQHPTAALLTIYALFLRVQGALGGSRRPPPLDTAHAVDYAQRLAPVARGWAWLGPSTHVLVMGAAVLCDQLAAYVMFRLTVGNVVMAALYLAQRARERALTR